MTRAIQENQGSSLSGRNDERSEFSRSAAGGWTVGRARGTASEEKDSAVGGGARASSSDPEIRGAADFSAGWFPLDDLTPDSSSRDIFLCRYGALSRCFLIPNSSGLSPSLSRSLLISVESELLRSRLSITGTIRHVHVPTTEYSDNHRCDHGRQRGARVVSAPMA